MKTFCVALAGNPNTGKSTIFNALTGSQQHVGNWPGKTVAKKAGYFDYQKFSIEVIDLPGTYSLAAFSPDEEVTRDFIVQGEPDVVVNVVDVTNLERNLYLTTQILEVGAPMVLVLNMNDVATRRGFNVDRQKLSQMLGNVPVIPAAASKGEGLERLRQAIFQFINGRKEYFNGSGLMSNDDIKRTNKRVRFNPGCHV
jgi:ferrous iron transport protein B